jgi:hypothetical protein
MDDFLWGVSRLCRSEEVAIPGSAGNLLPRPNRFIQTPLPGNDKTSLAIRGWAIDYIRFVDLLRTSDVERLTQRMIVIFLRDFLRGVRERKTAFSHHFDEVSKAAYVTQVPTHA